MAGCCSAHHLHSQIRGLTNVRTDFVGTDTRGGLLRDPANPRAEVYQRARLHARQLSVGAPEKVAKPFPRARLVSGNIGAA